MAKKDEKVTTFKESYWDHDKGCLVNVWVDQDGNESRTEWR